VNGLTDLLWAVLGVLVLAYVAAGWEIHSWLLDFRETAKVDQDRREDRKP
jgi:hypothetical protein